MATESIVGGLFGVTPQAYQQAQQQRDLEAARGFAGLTPYQQVSEMAFAGGRGLGRALGGLMGVEDPQLKQISVMNELASQFDTSTSGGVAGLAQALANRGLQAPAIQLGQRALEMRKLEAEAQAKATERLTNEQKNAAAIADSSGALRSSPEWSEKYRTELERITAKAEKAPPSMVAEYQFAKTPEGGGFRGSFQEFVTARALASRPPAQPRPEQPPVAVVDPVTNKVIYVSREEAIANKLTPATAMEGLSPKEIQNREAKYPQAKAAVETFQTNAEKLAKDLETLAESKGLEGITGLIGGRTPAVTKEARAAEALYNSIVARGGFTELQNMRNASPTGGALGNVSNLEGQQLRDAFAALKLTQNASDLKAALRRAAEDTRASAGRIKDTFDLTYDYKTQRGQGGTAPSPTKAPMSADDLVNKYLNK